MNLMQSLQKNQKGWLVFRRGKWKILSYRPRSDKERRLTLIQFFGELAPTDDEKARLRSFWSHCVSEENGVLPTIIGRDGFLSALAKAKPLELEWARYLATHYKQHTSQDVPFEVETQKQQLYHCVRPTPEGLLAKLSVQARLAQDAKQIEESLDNFSKLTFEKRGTLKKWQTFATLAHGIVYRELDKRELWLPDFNVVGKMVHYTCAQDLISEGIKTVSLFPEKGSRARGIYLIQGTNPYPSQPQTIGSFLENFGKGGSGRGAYEHSWRRIHKHLKKLIEHTDGQLVTIVGHSLGGSLAIQLALYSQVFVEESYAFNPPMPQEVDFDYYKTLPKESQQKLHLFINGDDFASWRLGACLFGHVHLVLGTEPWHAQNIRKRDVTLVVPYLYKLLKNFAFTIPIHISSFLLDTHFVVVNLTDEELAIENQERSRRIDHMKFLPALHSSFKDFFRSARRFFSRSGEGRMLKNELELISLQQEELRKEGCEEALKKVDALEKKKEELMVQLTRLEMQKKR